MAAVRRTGTTDTCSIDGCGRQASRGCPACQRPLCRECWCAHEIDAARARNIARGAYWEPRSRDDAKPAPATA